MSLLLEIGAQSDVRQSTRIKCFDIISTFAARKSKLFVKSNIVRDIVYACIRIMASPSQRDEDPEEQSVKDYVSEVLDSLASYLPSEVVFPVMGELISTTAGAPDAQQRAASMKALFACLDGCQYYITENNLLPSILDTVLRLFRDPHPAVQEAAALALTKIVQTCPTEVASQHAVVLPCILQCCNGSTVDLREYATYALEALVEAMGDGVQPYLPQLMEHWIAITRLHDDVHVVALSSISIIAKAVKGKFAPYFDATMAHVRELVVGTALILNKNTLYSCILAAA